VSTLSPTPSLIDQSVLFERIGYTPHGPEQWAIHNSTARFTVPCCGRRFGKSQSTGHKMTQKMFTPDTVNWIVGPTYKLGEKEFRVVWDDFKKLGLLDKCKKSYNKVQGNMYIRTPWDSLVEVVSAEKQESLVGEGLSHVIMSEAAKHKMSTWQMYIEPALSDHRGSADFPSTPEGFNWYRGLYDMGQHPGFPEYESWRFPTWTNHVMFPGGEDDPELLRIKGTVSEQYWLQEYAAEFTTFAGQIYPEFDEMVHVRPITYNPAWRNYEAWDFGYNDPTVVLDIMVDGEDNVYVWREYQVSGKSTWEHGFIIKHRDNPDGHHVTARFADPHGRDQIETLKLVLGHLYAEEVSWAQGVEAVKRWLRPSNGGRPKLYIDPSCTHLIRQMGQLRAKALKEGQNERPGQHDYDDHGPDALRYFFNHFLVLGQGITLESVYSPEYAKTEAAGFFTYSTGISLGNRIGF
jgi:hypothetical protein